MDDENPSLFTDPDSDSEEKQYAVEEFLKDQRSLKRTRPADIEQEKEPTEKKSRTEQVDHDYNFVLD